MVCPHCGENNPDNAKYCSRCSATLPKKPKRPGSPAPSSGMDPKTIIIIIMAVLLVIGVIVFIVSKAGKSGGNDVAEEVTEEESEEESEEVTEEATEEDKDDEDKEEEKEETDWTKDKGLEVEKTDKTSFTFKTMKVKIEDDEDDSDEDENEDVDEKKDEEETEEEFEVSSKLTISETTENAPDGYKLVSAVFIDDVSKSDGDSGVLADGAFDRYTGTYFGFENGKPEQEGDDKADLDDFVRITNGDEHYDVTVMSEIDVNGSSIKKTITVVCPEDYDGTVFYAGYSSKELDEKLKAIDFSKKLYTFDELPFMDDDHDMYYFSYEKTDSSGRSSWSTYDVEEEPVQETSSETTNQGPPK